jgi:hypothetical protein
MNQAPTADEAKGFLSRLFDFSFQSFITTSVVRIIYILLVGFSALGALAFVGVAATNGAAGLIVGLLIAPVVFLLYVMMSRIWLELVIVIFRIAENIDVIARSSERRP